MSGPLPATVDRARAILAAAVPSGRVVTLAELAREIGCSERSARGAVHWLRRQGVPVVSVGEPGCGGYRLAQGRAEIEALIAEYRRHLDGAIARIEAIEALLVVLGEAEAGGGPQGDAAQGSPANTRRGEA